jgi:hypothetical protein
MGECAKDVSGLFQCKLAGVHGQFLFQLTQCLSQGFTIYWDRKDLFTGENWREKLFPCFGASQAAIILINESALHSHWVPLEAMVFMWRKLLDNKLLVIPVYFDGIEPDRLRGENSPFRGLGIEDLQGIKAGADHAATIAAIEKALERIAIPDDLDEIVILNKLSNHISMGMKESFPAAAQELHVELQEYALPKELQLALGILRLGLVRSSTAIKMLQIGRDKQKEVLNLLAPIWVDPRAAAPLWHYGRQTSAKPVLVINGTFQTTPADYTARAWSHRWDTDWPIIKVTTTSTGMGVEGLVDDVLRAFGQSCLEIEQSEWNEELAEHTLAVVKTMAANRLPIYAVFEYSERLDPNDLVEVQGRLPEVTILYLAKGYTPAPEPGRFEEPEPKLTPQTEKNARVEIDAARMVLER